MTGARDNREHLGQRLLAAYDDMPRGERKLADVLLEDVDMVRHATAGELADRAGVSKATAARLFSRLGYTGFRAAQREVRAGSASAPSGGTGGSVPASGSTLSAFLDAEVRQMVRTFQHLRSDEVETAVRLLRDGEKLWVVGFGDDYALAHFARAQFIKLRSDIRMIPIAGFPIPEEFSSITANDTVLALGVGRRTNMLRNVIGSAARAGANVILVTNTVSAGDRSVASVILRGRSGGVSPLGSMTATFAIVTYLCAQLAQRIGEKAADRMRVIEAINEEWGDGSGKATPTPPQK